MPLIVRWFLRLGPTNPIAARLVQNGSRRTKHFYIRAAYLAVLIVVLLWSLLAGTLTSGDLDYRKLAAAGSVSGGHSTPAAMTCRSFEGKITSTRNPPILA